jgi:hypothetical protein
MYGNKTFRLAKADVEPYEATEPGTAPGVVLRLYSRRATTLAPVGLNMCRADAVALALAILDVTGESASQQTVTIQ